MNRLRLALIIFSQEIDKVLEDLLNLDSAYFDNHKRSVDFNKLSKKEKFFFICKLIVDWFES